MDEALELARAVAANAPLSLRAIKQAVRQGAVQPLEAALQTELSHYRTLIGTNDRDEGIRAFNEKRKPVFEGK